MMTFARDTNPVRALRERKQLKLGDLAKLVKISAGLMSMIEGGFTPKRPTQQKIAAALDTSVEKLWPDEGEYV